MGCIPGVSPCFVENAFAPLISGNFSIITGGSGVERRSVIDWTVHGLVAAHVTSQLSSHCLLVNCLGVLWLQSARDARDGFFSLFPADHAHGCGVFRRRFEKLLNSNGAKR